MSRLDSFKAALTGGGARPNMFRVRGSFPSGASSVLGNAAGAVAGAAGAGVGAIAGGIGNLLGGGGPSAKLEFLVKSAQLPQSNLGVIEVPFRGRQLKLPGDRTFTEWSITVINDTDFAIRNAFENWSDAINSHIQNIGPSGLQAITTVWEVEQLNKEGGVIKTYTFEDCWPSEIGPVDLSFDSSDTIEEFTVSLQYSYWRSDTTT